MEPQVLRLPNAGRKLNRSWIEVFVEETEGLSSPLIFRKWAAIMTISGALEQNVWCISRYEKLFPNLYSVLVGPPGVGKTVVISVVRLLWKKLKDVHVAPSNVSRASLVDCLNDAIRTSSVKPQALEPITSFNHLNVGSRELGAFLSSYDSDFIAVLTDIYDGKEDFDERKRGKDLRINIAHPSLTFFAGTTPSYLNGLFSDGAWDQGFASRTVFVYSGEIILGDIFLEGSEPKAYQDLTHDLQHINRLSGKFDWDADVAGALTEWYKAKGPPAPTHPKLLHYQTRRHAHLMKLCMIASAARRSDLRITDIEYQEALAWLLEAEAWMPEIFKASLGADHKIMDDIWHYTYQIWIKERKPILASRVVGFASRLAPVMSVGRIIETMVKSNMLKQTTEKEGTCYMPQERKQE